jgi:hypothetical protein
MGSKPQSSADTAMDAQLCVWITQPTSGRASWIALWIT